MHSAGRPEGQAGTLGHELKAVVHRQYFSYSGRFAFKAF